MIGFEQAAPQYPMQEIVARVRCWKNLDIWERSVNLLKLPALWKWHGP